jgi:hypothetical protein
MQNPSSDSTPPPKNMFLMQIKHASDSDTENTLHPLYYRNRANYMRAGDLAGLLTLACSIVFLLLLLRQGAPSLALNSPSSCLNLPRAESAWITGVLHYVWNHCVLHTVNPC